MKAAIYDAVMWPVEKLWLRPLRQRLVSTARGRVLEVGIGTGANLLYYPAEVELTSIDPNENFLKRAHHRAAAFGRPITLFVGHAEELPFADQSFDTVIAAFVFCTVADPVQALHEVHRVLKPGGQFKLLEHVRVRNPLGAKIQDLLTPLWKHIANGCHLNRDTLSSVQSNGFRVESTQEYFRGLVLEIETRAA
jgi:ubiquinone/menaquinone biosynthesis C-methylase UbiE